MKSAILKWSKQVWPLAQLCLISTRQLSLTHPRDTFPDS